jgi:hypothetical protein
MLATLQNLLRAHLAFFHYSRFQISPSQKTIFQFNSMRWRFFCQSFQQQHLQSTIHAGRK